MSDTQSDNISQEASVFLLQTRFAVLEEVQSLLGLTPQEMASVLKTLCKSDGGSLCFIVGGLNIQLERAIDIHHIDEKGIGLMITFQREKTVVSANYKFSSHEIAEQTNRESSEEGSNQ